MNLLRVLSDNYTGTTMGWRTEESGLESGKVAEA